jgi:hypothetical protein
MGENIGYWWLDNIKMDLGETEWDGMDWIHVDQDRNLWRALVHMVMNRDFLKIVGNSEVAACLVASQEGPISMKRLVSELFGQIDKQLQPYQLLPCYI